jgi:hypothetical protein
MTAWVKIAGGWALNLDGSNAGSVFSLPRLEVRASPRGWENVCLMADGTQAQRPGGLASLPAAKEAALEQASRMLGPAHAAALAALRGVAGH